MVQTGLNPASVLGGTRSVYVGSLNLATVSTDPIKGRFRFTANQSLGYFTLGWGSVSLLNINLSAGGNDWFRFELTDSSPLFTAGIFQLRVKSGNNWFNTDLHTDVTSALNGQTFGGLSIRSRGSAGQTSTPCKRSSFTPRACRGNCHCNLTPSAPSPSRQCWRWRAGICLWCRRQQQ